MPSNNDNYLKILEKISEVSERTARIETKVDTVERDIEYIKSEDARQNELLAEHIMGVKSNTARLEEEKRLREMQVTKLDSRVESLEITPKFFKTLKTALLYIAAVCGALLTIGKFLGMW